MSRSPKRWDYIGRDGLGRDLNRCEICNVMFECRRKDVKVCKSPACRREWTRRESAKRARRRRSTRVGVPARPGGSF